MQALDATGYWFSGMAPLDIMVPSWGVNAVHQSICCSMPWYPHLVAKQRVSKIFVERFADEVPGRGAIV